MAEILEERILAASPTRIASLLTSPGSWLMSAAEQAGRLGQETSAQLSADVGRPGARAQLRKRVVFRVGETLDLRERIVIPVTWEAAGFAGLFPVMDAIIELHPAGHHRTHIVFWGRYDPPLGRTGDLVDRLLAHHVTEATVRGLLDTIAAKASMRTEGGVPAGA